MTDLAPEGDDVTMLELERNLGVRGFDTEVWVEPDGQLRCSACGTTAAVAEWRVEDVRRAAGDGGLAAAVRCPSCRIPGRLLLPADSPVVADVERSRS